MVAESQRRLETIKAEAQPKINAVEAARAAMDAAEVPTAAQETAKLAQRSSLRRCLFLSAAKPNGFTCGKPFSRCSMLLAKFSLLDEQLEQPFSPPRSM